jgi:glycosyltransferase involved in cell wall biosynthesis
MLPAQAAGSELILSPANLAPLASRRNAVVIHDAAALRHPEAYSPAFVAYHRAVLPRLAQRARLLITVSTFSKGELVELLGAAPERIVVIPEGVDARFSPNVDPAPARRAHALDRRYVLVVGTVSDRKNLGALESATRALRARDIELVLAGSDRRYLRGAAPGLRRLGYVAEEHLPGLYAGAEAVVMPSLYEGFGLPCLEAMASGVPLVAADAAALPETCGDAALLVDATDPLAVADALLRALDDQALRRGLRDAGLARAAYFSWQRTAELTDEALGGLLGTT